MRRRASWLVGLATGCGNLPAGVTPLRELPGYFLGKIDGRAEERRHWQESCARALEIVELEQLFDDEDGDR